MTKKIGLIPYRIQENEETNEKTFEICLLKQPKSNSIPFVTYSEIGYNAIECILKRAKMRIGFMPLHGAKILKLYDSQEEIIFGIEAEKCGDGCEWVTKYEFLPEEYLNGVKKIIKKYFYND